MAAQKNCHVHHTQFSLMLQLMSKRLSTQGSYRQSRNKTISLHVGQDPWVAVFMAVINGLLVFANAIQAGTIPDYFPMQTNFREELRRERISRVILLAAYKKKPQMALLFVSRMLQEYRLCEVVYVHSPILWANSFGEHTITEVLKLYSVDHWWSTEHLVVVRGELAGLMMLALLLASSC